MVEQRVALTTQLALWRLRIREKRGDHRSSIYIRQGLLFSHTSYYPSIIIARRAYRVEIFENLPTPFAFTHRPRSLSSSHRDVVAQLMHLVVLVLRPGRVVKFEDLKKPWRISSLYLHRCATNAILDL